MAEIQQADRVYAKTARYGKPESVLIVASVASMIDQFNIPNIRLLISLGYQVDVAANFKNGNTCTRKRLKELLKLLDSLSVDCYQIDFERKLKNPVTLVRVFRQLDYVVTGRAVPVNPVFHHPSSMRHVKYSFMHSHSPAGGAAGRLIAKKHGIMSVYTAHGFHFYQGAPLKNWLLFYPVERALSRITDVLITINREDYKRAVKKLHAKKTVYIPGVGIDRDKFQRGAYDSEKERAQAGIGTQDIVLLSVGELIPRKNHEAVIRAIPKLGNSHVQYFIAGKGELEKKLKLLARKCGVDKQVHFLGFRTDIPQLCHVADIFVFPSHQEGLPVALMEAAACKVPIACSDIRGNTDIVRDSRFLFDENSIDSVVRCLRPLTCSREQLKAFAGESAEKNYCALKAFDLSSVSRMMKALYEEIGEEIRIRAGRQSQKHSGRRKRVCILRSNPVNPDSRVEKEAEAFKEAGYDVHILCWDRESSHRPYKEYIHNGQIPVTRIGYQAGYAQGRKSAPAWIKFQISMVRWILKKGRRFDVIHACDIDTALFSYFPARISKCQFVFDVFDFVCGEPENLWQHIVQKLQFMLVNRADAVIICSEQRKKQIKGTHPKRLCVVHNSPEQLLIGSHSPMNVKKDRLSVVYVGVLLKNRLLGEILSYFSKHPEHDLYLGGFGIMEHEIEQAAETYDNIHFAGRIPYDETLALEQLCDVMIAAYDPAEENNRMAAPNKFYESLMLGKPMIMAENTGMSDVLVKHDIGVLIEYSEKGFARGLDKIMQRRAEWPQMAERMHALYEKEYSWQIMKERLLGLYEALFREERKIWNL